MLYFYIVLYGRVGTGHMVEKWNEEDVCTGISSREKVEYADEGVDVYEIHDQEEGRREQYEQECVVRGDLQGIRLELILFFVP